MWISKNRYNELRAIENTHYSIGSIYYKKYLNERNKAKYYEDEANKKDDNIRKLYRELEEYKQKYADEVQKRLDLINQIDCNKIDKAIEEIEIAFYKMK